MPVYKHMHAKNALLVDFEDRFQMCRLNFLPLDPFHHSQSNHRHRRKVCMGCVVTAALVFNPTTTQPFIFIWGPPHTRTNKTGERLFLRAAASVRARARHGRRGHRLVLHGAAPGPDPRQGGAAGEGGGRLPPAAGGAARAGARDGQSALVSGRRGIQVMLGDSELDASIRTG